ncbi:MAG: SusC/RagA family TonB-linked outer membrane protein [Prolixibacteraceae bacterium]|nr:SusC/RagA family TonB-linked outer membrane protein [Prolixibacteraceae bacterium]
MQKQIFLLITFLLIGATVFAQKANIEGTVKTSNGESLPSATILVKGTTIGTLSDDKGHFVLQAEPKDILVASYIGFETVEVSVGNQKVITIILEDSKQEIKEVIVTALGIEKVKSTIGFAVQDVKGAELVKAREPNAINSLTGKIAGLTIGASSEILGAPSVLLRGATPLYVVDGVPVQTDTWNINPDDIESYTVLKGPTAAALYGSRGQYGAIQITTKRGTTDKRGFTVDFNSSSMVESGFLAIPEVQDEYGPGDHGKYAFADGKGNGLNDGDYDVWGPRFEGQLIPQYDGQYTPGTKYTTTFADGKTYEGNIKPTPYVARGKDNLKRFLENGLLSNNSLALSASGDKYDLRFSASHSYQKGIVPNTKLNITNFNLSGGYNISKKLRISSNMAYSRQYTPNVPDVQYGPNSIIYNIIAWGGADWNIDDMRKYWQPGKEGVQSIYAEYQRYHNPYFMSYEWLRGHYKNDLTGNATISYKFNNYISLQARTAISTYDLFRSEKLPYSAHPYGREAGEGDYREDKRNLFENNTDVLLSYDRYVVPKLSLHATAGGNIRSYSFRSSYATTDYMNVPGWYNLNNSKNPVKSYNFYAPMQVLSAYATADLTYDDFLTLSLTGRADKNSTLPTSHNTYFYPSVSTSIEMSKLVTIPYVKSWKVRGSYAKVGGALTSSTIGQLWVPGYGGNYYSPYDGPSYQNSASYSTGLIQGKPAAAFTNTITNPELKPESSSAWEVGTDVGLFENKLRFDVTYFSSIDGPKIYSLPISESTGYSSALVNAIKVQRKGVEINVSGSPVHNINGFSWDISANFSTNQRYLKEIYPGVEKLNIYLKVGDRMDKMYGSDFVRTTDGQLINDASGRPIRNSVPRYLGNANSDWAGAINNTLSYKNVSLKFQFDGRFGGTILDYVEQKTYQGGRHINTILGEMGEARINDTKGIKSYIGDGVKVSNGVAIVYDVDGNVTNYDKLQYAPNATPTFLQDYISRVYGTNSAYAISRTFVKLREVVLTYNLPQKFLQKTFIKQANISFVGRNLLYFAERSDIDIEQYVGTNGSSGLQTPTTRRFGFNLNITF